MKKILLLIILLVSQILYAEVYDFLNDTPGSYFTDRDWAIFLDTQKKVLNQTPDGTKVTWKNPMSGHWGTIEPSHTTHLCRDLTLFNDAEDRKGEATLKFCKIHGIWKGI